MSEQLGKTRCQRILGAVDVARGAEIELERSHGLPAHHERRDDARRNVAATSPLAAHVHNVGEGLGDTVIDDIARSGGVNGRPRRKILRELAHASEDHLAVGDGDGHRTGMRQQAAADLLGALVREAAGDVLEHLGRDGERLLGARRKILRELAHASEDHLAVGDGDGHRTGMWQQAAADLLGALVREAAGDVLEHLRRDGERLLGVLGAQRVRREERVDGDGDGHRTGMWQQAAADLLGALVREAAGDVLEHLRRDGERLLGVLGAQRVRREERVDELEDQDHEHRERREGRDRFDAREDGVAEQADQRENRHRAQQAYGGKRIDRGQAARTHGYAAAGGGRSARRSRA